MSRARLDYSQRSDVRAAGFDPDQPIEGYYRMRLKMGGAFVGVRIWYGAPLDPETGEEMDRSHRWQALVNDEYAPLDRCWPKCGSDPVAEAEYQYLAKLQSWARTNAPESSIADPRRLAHPLDNPLPF